MSGTAGRCHTAATGTALPRRGRDQGRIRFPPWWAVHRAASESRAFKFGGGIIFRACHYANGRLAIAQGFRFSMNYSFLTVSPLLAGTKQTLTDQRNFPVAQSTEYLLSVFQVRGAALGSVPGCRGQGRALCDLGAHAPAEQRSNKLVHVSMEEHDPWSGGSEPGR